MTDQNTHSTPEPTVPLRMEITVDLPGTPEQVWQAVATGNGITAWFLPTELEEKVGGAMVLSMGEQVSKGTVTAFDAPRRIEYVEPDWLEMAGHLEAIVSPMTTEFTVEARSGGTCTLRVVSSAFGVGADWEQEFFVEMERNWRPYFDNLRLYLSNFPGQTVTSMTVEAKLDVPVNATRAAIRRALGATSEGLAVDARGIRGSVERIGKDETVNELLLRVDEPVTGYLQFSVYGDPGTSLVTVQGYLFSDGAAEYVDREAPAWRAWLAGLAVPAAASPQSSVLGSRR